jgi:small subunit ribosomal protein S20
MPNHVSALKRVRQAKRKTTTNRSNKGVLRASLRSMRSSLATGQTPKELVSETVSRIDKSVRKGLIHRNTAARLKSRLMIRANAAKA